VEFIQRVTFAQALLGSFTVVMTYLLARLYFGPPWALLGGLLTALSPHLVALDHYILTESLFTFTIVLASLVLVISWRKRKPALSALAGMLFAFSPLIRPVALLLGPFMAIVYLFDESSWIAASKRVLIAQLLCFSIGIAVIYVPYGVFRQKTIARAASVKCESLWTHFIRGSDINMKNFGRRKVDREYGAELNKMAQNRIYGLNVLKERFISSPLSYLKWYMGGKTLFLWRWDNIYNTDVYQYPMVRKGFETNPWLHGIHRSMRWLHWPLFLLMLTVPAFAFVNWRLGILTARTVILLTPVLMFSYFAIVLTLLMPLPRYAIPARPFVYVLAIYPLNQVWCYGKMGRQRLKAFLFR